MKSILMILLSISSLTVFMSKTAIKGKVTDAQSGDPLVGAVITIKGTSIGAQTDVDGNFELKVKHKLKLRIEMKVGSSAQ